LLDLWLEQVDTEETLPLFEKTAREYTIPVLADVDWAEENPQLARVVRDKDYLALMRFQSIEDVVEVFEWLLMRDERRILGELFDHTLSTLLLPGSGSFTEHIDQAELFEVMADFLIRAPYLAITFTRPRGVLPEPWKILMQTVAPRLLTALIFSVNEIAELTIQPFKRVLEHVNHMSLPKFAELVESICVSVNSPELALDLLLGALEDAATRILTDRPIVIQHFVKNIIGVALEHLDEANEDKKKAKYLFNLRRSDNPRNVIASLRLDAPLSDQPRTGDHVRLIAAGSPVNHPIRKPYAMSAIVERSYQGEATFRCMHPPPPFLEGCSWRLINCGSFVTADVTLKAIVSFAAEKDEACRIGDLLLDLPGNSVDYSEVDALWTDQDVTIIRDDLNDSQNEAVSAALSSRLTCLWGPPGAYVLLLALLEIDPLDRRVLPQLETSSHSIISMRIATVTDFDFCVGTGKTHTIVVILQVSENL
jgi:regulator of nonsense transcripts 1